MKKKNIHISYIIHLLTFSILLVNCEKEVEVEIPYHVRKMVVEGWIEQGKGAQVILSLSAPFFASIDSNNLLEYSVTRAKVELLVDSSKEILTLKPNEFYFPPYYYFSSDILGKTGKEYNLEINYNDYTFTATTTIPSLTKPDSVWFVKHDKTDTLGVIHLKLSDNPDEVNYYRTLTKRLGKDKRFIPTFTSVFSDFSFNGEQLELSLYKGSANLRDFDQSRYFKVSDTIVLKFCSIDKAHYEFWNTVQNQAVTSANPFAISHKEIKSNIQNGFGIWGGYAASYDTIIAK